MFTRVTASTASDCNAAAIEVFQSQGINTTSTADTNREEDLRLHLIVGFSKKSLEESKFWSLKRGKFRNCALPRYQPYIQAVALFSESKKSRDQSLKGIDRILGRVSNILDDLDKVLGENGRPGHEYSTDEAEELKRELFRKLDKNEQFKNALFLPIKLSSLEATAVFRKKFQNECERKKQQITQSHTPELRKLEYRVRKAKGAPRCILLATDTDVWAQAVEILQAARELQSELGGAIVELHLHVIEDTWEASPGNSIAVSDVKYFFERIIDAMGDHLFQEPEADEGNVICVNSASASDCLEIFHVVRVHQFRNELYEWIRQLPVGTNSRRMVWEHCEKNLDSRVNELLLGHHLNSSATDLNIAERPSYLPEKLILEGLQAVEPKAFKRFRDDIFGRSKKTKSEMQPHATLDMFCKNYRQIGYPASDLVNIRDKLQKSHPSKDRYLRTMALLLLGGIVPKKDKTAYNQILLAQRGWELLDARFAKSGSNSFFQQLGGWKNLVFLGGNSHYSRREDPFLMANRVIGSKTFLQSERLQAELFYFIDEICWNPDECQPTKIFAFARNISNLCGADQEQWRTWLGPPEF